MIWLSKKRYISFMLLPSLVVYSAYLILPVIIAFYYSLTKFSGIGKPEFIGLKNYLLLMQDPFFWTSLKNTIIVLAVTLLILVPSSFLLALLLIRKVKGGNVLKALNFAPAVIAPILVGLIWVFILDPEIGFVNVFLQKIGLEELAFKWIGGETLTPYSVGIVESWRILGFIATIFLAGLTTIPREIYEASEIDGANKMQQLIFVTIPMLNETFKINVILIITFCFKIFETVLQLTNGGPNHLSEVLVTYMYNVTFISSEYGYGMAVAVVTFIITILFTGIYMMFTKKRAEN
ncbi:carbohydrate ABC transporter permease [Bacillus taeanensis]|uniref:Sugar ABC transporter permease n=1 Tax=Bacillus taeanensis TaxID=273032 RepID=A0A366Y3M8_9BACI|nr:sugar ABC transporter permease [Bacillus taeanensis]RBW70791.1 sugar ABC transporter permease [Bacillus taeanensis]